MNIDQLKKQLYSLESADFVGSISEAMVRDAEIELGVAFSPQYSAFIKEFGCGSIGSEEFIGLGGPVHLNIIEVKKRLTHRNRPIPVNYYPLRADGYGNYDCVDMFRPSIDGEYAIVEWRHDLPKDNSDRILALTYFEWVGQIIEMVLSEDQE